MRCTMSWVSSLNVEYLQDKLYYPCEVHVILLHLVSKMIRHENRSIVKILSDDGIEIISQYKSVFMDIYLIYSTRTTHHSRVGRLPL